MKKTIALLLVALLTFSLTALCGCKKTAPVIGISQFGEHASLDNCRIGFLAGLEEAGLKEGTDFVIDYQNASFSDATASQIAQSYSAKNVALICAIATPCATAAFAAVEEKDIPVVFTAITDPVEAKLTEGNVTGTSDKLPVTAQLELIRSVQPDAETIGIVYTSGEPNSVSAIRDYQDAVASYGFSLETIAVTSQSEVPQAVDTLISHKVDCISNLTDNTVVGVLPMILEKTDAANIPVYGSEVEQVKAGCLAAAGIDYVALGKRTGAMAAKILKGEAKASDMPYETIRDYGTYINSKTAAKLGISLPEAIKGKAIESGN